MASMFEVMDEASFPIVILDEARYVCNTAERMRN